MKDQNISRLEIFCNDTLVMPIKRMLLGMKGVHEINDQPVINAKASKNGLRAKSGGTAMEMFVEYLRSNKLTTVTRTDVKDFCRSIGKTTADGWLIKKGQESGLLVKNKARSGDKKFVYDVKG